MSLAATAPLNLGGLAAAESEPAPERFVLAWGDNTHRQCMVDDTSGIVASPKLVPCRRVIRSCAAGWQHSMFIDSSGFLWGGGSNKGSCLSQEEEEEEHVRLTRLDLKEIDGVPFECVQVGREHALAILEGGHAVVSWGSSNEFGQLGRGSRKKCGTKPGVVHLSGVTVKQVACGEFHSLVLTVQGEVYAFGANSFGALGTGKREPLEEAQKVVLNHLRGMPVRGIAAGAQSSMALSIGGQVFCWGCNSQGRLGLGPEYDRQEAVLSPVVVPQLPGMARAIAAGGRHSAVILRKGRLFLAGDNASGQLGQSRADLDWTSTFSELPLKHYTLRVRTAALGRAHTLILSYDGDLYACGCNADGQLGDGRASPSSAEPTPPVDEPVRVVLDSETRQERVVVGIASCHNHAVVLALSVQAARRTGVAAIPCGGLGAGTGRPQTSAPQRSVMSAFDPSSFAQTARAGSAQTALRTIHEDAADAIGKEPMCDGKDLFQQGSPSATPLSSGCTSRLGRSSRGVVVSLIPRHGSKRVAGTSEDNHHVADDVVLLQPVMQPGVAGSVGFAGLSVARLGGLVHVAAAAAAPDEGKNPSQTVEDLREALATAFSTPTLLNASFCFPGLFRPRLDAGGLMHVYTELSGAESLLAKIEAHLTNAAFEGLENWANDHTDASSLLHRDQLRGLPALMLSPIFENPEQAQPYELMSRMMRLVAWMPPEGRCELQEIVVEDCSQEEVLRSLVQRVRDHCDETVRRAHQMQRLSPEIWEGLMLLQLLWGANEAVAKRLTQSLHMQPQWPEQDDLGASLTQTLRGGSLSLSMTVGQLSASLRATSAATASRSTGLLERFASAAPRVNPPVPAAEFHLLSLAEELVPPELEFRLFIENACAGPITPAEVLELPLYAAKTDYGFEYVLPSKMRSFMANRNLVPVSYTRKVLQVENHHAQVYLQHQVARRVAADLEVLPGHEIHIDPALLFFILKVRRDNILEDTTAALQRATPEDLRRQLKVVFEGEQGVDEGGLAREFFRLLSAKIFAADCGLFDAAVAQNARALWFDMNSPCESTDFWLAGVILGLVVYNNMPGLDVRFPSAVFKKIKDEPLELEDLRQVYPDTFLSLRSLLQWEPEYGMGKEEASSLFENTFCLDFIITYDVKGKPQTRELCKDGKDRPVTLANRAEFVKLYCDWLLVGSVDKQFEPFRKGVRRVCDSPLFNALDSAELALIVCGEQELDFAQLRRNAHYDGFAEDAPYIESFWKILLEFDVVRKKRFLTFVTGSDLAPVGGLQELQLVIQRNSGEPTERLPTAHTCFNLLLLPEYESEVKLERMLTIALHNAEGFGLE